MRITNNKNIKTMEQKDIDIYEILKGMPDGTPLYTPMCGNVEFRYLQDNKEAAEAIITNTNNGAEYTFNKNGKYVEGGEVMLFPSKEMRDWSKFAWKKGDVLVNNDNDVYIIFEKFEDDAYTRFKGKHYLWKQIDNVDYSKEESQMVTSLFEKVNDYEAQTYISTIEEKLGGKLNLETLEIEKPAFEIGKLYVFDEEDEDGNVTVIGELIGKYESEDTLRFGNQYEIETEKFVTDQAFDLRISVHEELREATENEIELFEKHYSIWEKGAKEQPAFKPFDKVLVRSRKESNWVPAFFVRDRGEKFSSRYTALTIHIGAAADFAHCIPFEGNEHLAFTSDPL